MKVKVESQRKPDMNVGRNILLHPLDKSLRLRPPERIPETGKILFLQDIRNAFIGHVQSSGMF